MTTFDELEDSLRIYSNQHGITIEDSLGFGQDGAVWRSSRETAIKVLERERTYLNERDAYLLLQDQQISHIGPFDVPQLYGFDDSLRVVEIGIVSPPYVLDFGKAYVDREPPYTAEQLDENLEICRELFDPADWDDVESALTDLAMIGIAYLDIKPANIRVR